jgi:hypothetical protein
MNVILLGILKYLLHSVQKDANFFDFITLKSVYRLSVGIKLIKNTLQHLLLEPFDVSHCLKYNFLLYNKGRYGMPSSTFIRSSSDSLSRL